MLKVLFIAVILCLIINMPIGFSLGLASVAALFVDGNTAQMLLIPQRIVAGMNSFPLLAIVYFMIAGAVMELGGVSKRIISLASAFVGHKQGGVASAAVISCAIFAAISGSTPATAAAIGSITIPEMDKRGYPTDYSSAVVASSACLGVIIPPSITMVVFANTCGTSVGQGLMAGIIPGIILCAALCFTNWLFCRKAGYEVEPKCSHREVWLALKEAFWAILMPVIILGGIMSGFFTPTESAAIAILYGLVVGFFVYRELKVKDLGNLFYKGALNSAMIMILIGCSSPFGYIMTTNKVPEMFSNFILGISSNYYVVYGLVLVIFLILGTFMETSSIILLTVPIMTPIMRAIGANMVHFACVGGISKVTMGQISRKVWPFLLVMVLCLFLFMAFPGLCTFLPSIMFD